MDDPRDPPPVAPMAAALTVVVAVVLLSVIAGLFILRGGPGAPPDREPPDAFGSTAIPDPTRVTPSDSLPELPTVPPSLCPQVPLTQPLTALSFNIHAGLGGGGLNLDRVAAEIAGWEPDIVLLQEVDAGRPRTAGQQQADRLGELTAMNAVYGGNQRKPGGGSIGNAILSRHPIVESTNLLLPRAGGREQRGLLHAVIDVNGLEVSAYSTHWDHASWRARRAQARTVAATIAADQRPVIVGGDLNTMTGSPPLRTLRRAGLGDAWSVGEGDGLTVPAGSPRRRIDFVLHDGWFTPLQAAVLRSAVSDHRAVWARLELREEIDCIAVGEGGG